MKGLDDITYCTGQRVFMDSTNSAMLEICIDKDRCIRYIKTLKYLTISSNMSMPEKKPCPYYIDVGGD